VKAAMPDDDVRADFVRGLLRTFLDNDTDPGDLLGQDHGIDRLMGEIDSEF
jgi:hypothetical protein